MRATHTTRSLAVLAALLFCAAPCLAQDALAARVDDFVRAEMLRQRVPGVSLAVVRDGRVVLAKGYGYANVEHQVPVRPETVFQSGSVGKQFTAAAVMMLVEEGKLGLDEKIGRYLGGVPASWSDITVRHLLTHTAGMTDYPKDFDYRRDYTEGELLKLAQAVPLDFRPGERWQYSNLGYIMLGILIHRVTGKFYGDFLQERIFRPLGMTTARIISEADIVPNRAAGYRLVGGELKNQEWVAPSVNTTADGALYLTALDMSKWDAALYGERLLRKSSLEQMWAPVKLRGGRTHPYGFGWELGEANGRRVVSHQGGWQGFKAFITRYPDDRFTVILFANLAEANQRRLAQGVVAVYHPELVPPPTAAIEDAEPSVTAMVKDLLQKFAEGEADRTLFTKEAQAAIFPERAARFGEFLKLLGGLKEVQLIERRDEDEHRVYRYRLAYRDAALSLTLSLSREGRIAGVRAEPE